MIVKFDGKEYPYDPRAVDVKAAMVIKDRSGWGVRSWERAIDDGDPLALQLLYWVIKGQNGEPCDPLSLNFSITDFYEAVTAAAVEELAAKVAAEDVQGKDEAAE